MENGTQMTFEEYMQEHSKGRLLVLRIPMSGHFCRRKANWISRKPLEPVFQSYVPYRTARGRK